MKFSNRFIYFNLWLRIHFTFTEFICAPHICRLHDFAETSTFLLLMDKMATVHLSGIEA